MYSCWRLDEWEGVRSEMLGVMGEEEAVVWEGYLSAGELEVHVIGTKVISWGGLIEITIKHMVNRGLDN